MIHQRITNFLNENRLKNYPRVIGIVMWLVFIINFLSRRGWKGGIGTLISFDFLTFYAIGEIYKTNITQLYDVKTLFAVEQIIYNPTSLDGGGNIFSYPPYVALLSSLLTLVPYDTAYYIWTLLSIFFISLTVYLSYRYLLNPELSKYGLNFQQLLIVIFSFFPLLFGLNLGQNHALTLLLVTAIVITSLREHWFLSGALAGMLVYKPQFVLGFLIVWLVWRRYKALTGFVLVASVWFLSVIIVSGVDPYLSYIKSLPFLIELPYGVGRYLELSVFSFLATIFPRSALSYLIIVNQVILILASIGLAWIAHRTRGKNKSGKTLAFMFAILYPFLIAPHILIHDIVVLIPLFFLWSTITTGRHLLYVIIITYLGTVLLLFITLPTGIALLALIPIGILILVSRDSKPYLHLGQ